MKQLLFQFSITLCILMAFSSRSLAQTPANNTITQDQLRIIQLENEVKTLNKKLNDQKAAFKEDLDKRERTLKELQKKDRALSQQEYGELRFLVFLYSGVFLALITAVGFLLNYLGRQYINNTAKQKIEELANKAVKATTEEKVTALLTDDFVKGLIEKKGEGAIDELAKRLRKEFKSSSSEVLEGFKEEADSEIGKAKRAQSLLDAAKREYEKLRIDLSKIDFSKLQDRELDEETKQDLAAFEDALDDVKEERDFTAEDWFLKGLAEKDEKKYKQAVHSFSEAIKIDEKNIDYLYWRGFVLDDLKDFKAVISDLDRVIELNSRHDAAWNNRGLVKIKVRDFDGAINDLNQALKLEPKNDMAWNNRGSLKVELEDYEGAMSDFKESIMLNPKNQLAWNNRGALKNDLDDFYEAITDLNKAIELDHEYANSHAHRAYSHLMLDNLDQAIADNQKAMELDPEYNRAHYYQGLIEEKQGNMDAACKAWKKAVELGFDEAQEKVDAVCGG